jgi:hypothetical protein
MRGTPYLLMIEVPGTVGFIQPGVELGHGEYFLES